MNNIIIGNCISLVAAVFMAVSCAVKNNKTIFYLQAANCLILAVASVFFGAFAGVTTLLVSAVRNIVVAHGKYTKPVMYLFLVITVILGLITNNRGFIGLLPVIATVQYTICLNLLRGLFLTRITIFVNTLLWVIYSFIIRDFSTACMDSISLITVTVVIVHMVVKKEFSSLKTR